MIEKSACGIMEFSEDTDRGRIISRNVHGATEDGERGQVIWMYTRHGKGRGLV